MSGFCLSGLSSEVQMSEIAWEAQGAIRSANEQVFWLPSSLASSFIGNALVGGGIRIIQWPLILFDASLTWRVLQAFRNAFVFG